jgi:hypothetical protein
MTEEYEVIEMNWRTAVPLLLEIIQNAETPKARIDAREELLRCARIADQAVTANRYDPEADVVVEDDGYRVTLEHIGEGLDGDYDPEDADDVRLLRFSVDRIEPVENGSYCTQLPITISREQKRKAGEIILRELQGGGSVKRTCERLSWLETTDLVDTASPSPEPTDA